MITLLHHPIAHMSTGVRVLLDIQIKDVDEMPDDARELLEATRAQNRKVGCILRQFGGDTYFTYDPADQAQHEVSLIAALAVPKADIHVTQNAGGRGKWQTY